MRALAPILMVALLLGCGADPRLIIDLEVPAGTLDPLKDKRLSKFSLRLTRGQQTTSQEVFRAAGAELQVGLVPVAEPLDLRLAGHSASGLMLGLGQVLDLTVDDTENTHISIKFRKPIGYVIGHNQVQVLDAVANTPGTLELAPLAVANGKGITAMRNGVVLLVTSGSSLVPVRTADHSLLPAVKLGSQGACVEVSRDDRQAVICHPQSKRLGIVDLASLGTAQAQETHLSLPGVPSRILFSRDRRRALVLLDAKSHRQPCGGAHSRLVELDLSTGKAGAAQSLGAQVADIALDPRDEALLAVLPCKGTLRLSRPGAAAQEVSIPATHDMAASDRNLVLVGTDSGAKVKGQASLFDLTTGEGLSSRQNKTFDFDPVVIRLNSAGSRSGYFGWASEPQSLSVYDLSLSPDSQRALLLFEAQFASDMKFDSCLYQAKLKASGYLLLDLEAGVVLVRRFTRLTFDVCHANCVANPQQQPLNSLGTCAAEFKRVMRQDHSLLSGSAEFDPQGARLLFGGS